MLIYNGKPVSVISAVRNGSVVGIGKVIRNSEVVWSAGQDPVGYRYPVYNVGGDPGSGISCWLDGSVDDYYFVRSGSGRTSWTDGWYVVSGDVTIGGADCVGEVKLILMDGASLVINAAENDAGICVTGEDGISLAIYGQAGDTGTLNATGGSYGAGIGGSKNGSGSDITINGGTVTATGGTGIGGGFLGAGQNITINGGTVTVTGNNLGAGIGGGCAKGLGGTGITINGGAVTAKGGEKSAGIGGGYMGYASNIRINNGIVTAVGGEECTGVGCGYNGESSNIYVSTGLIVKSDNYYPPSVVIEHADDEDIASKLKNKQYVSAVPIS